MKTVYIETVDDDLIDALSTLAIPGVQVTVRLQAAVTLKQAIIFTVVLSGNIATGLFTNWLYDWIKDGGTENCKTKLDRNEIEKLRSIIAEIEDIKRDDGNDVHK